MAAVALIVLFVVFGFFIATAPQEFIQIMLMLSWALMILGAIASLLF